MLGDPRLVDLHLLRCLLEGLGGHPADAESEARSSFLLRACARYRGLCPDSLGPISDLRRLVALPARHPAVRRIVSGGQTGADRGGLDAAIAAGISIGGWCPVGLRAEDGVIPVPYALHLRQAPDASWSTRTRLNVRDSDATLVCSLSGRLSGGSALTWALAARLSRPRKHLCLSSPDLESRLDDVRSWISDSGVTVLNIAGPRESREPGIQVATRVSVASILGSPRG